MQIINADFMPITLNKLFLDLFKNAIFCIVPNNVNNVVGICAV